MDEFEARAGAYISQHQMLQKGILLSWRFGGADSMALFHFVFRAECVGLRLRAAHVNHGLRGAAADGAPPLCAQCAARVFRWMRRCSRRLKTRESGAGRNGTLFARLAQAHGAKVATAHTCSDNAETVLFNLARGSAARGAAASARARAVCAPVAVGAAGGCPASGAAACRIDGRHQ
ncbi:MAG: ATP-binding protein [Ruthenibacterium lactatiformans]